MTDCAPPSLSPYETHNLLTLLDMQEGRLIALFSCATRTGAVHLDEDELARAITQVDQVSTITHRLTGTRKTLAQMDQMQLHFETQLEKYHEKKSQPGNAPASGNTGVPAAAGNAGVPPAISSNACECGRPTPSGDSSIHSSAPSAVESPDYSKFEMKSSKLNPSASSPSAPSPISAVKSTSVHAAAVCPTIPIDKIKAYAAETEAMIQAWEKANETPEAEREPQPAAASTNAPLPPAAGNAGVSPAISSISNENENTAPPLNPSNTPAQPGNAPAPPAISSISPVQSLNPPIPQSLNALILPGTPADYANFPGPCDNCGRPFCDNRLCWAPPSQFTLDYINGLHDDEEDEPVIQWVPGSPPPIRPPRIADG